MPRRQQELDYNPGAHSPIIGGLGIAEDDIILQLVRRDMSDDRNSNDDDFDGDDYYYMDDDSDLDV